MNAIVAGVGMTTFGKHMDRQLKSLAVEAIQSAIEDAGLSLADIEAAYYANVAAGTMVGQVCIPGQVALREMGLGGIPVVNVKNACASASTAFHQGCAMVSAGVYDVVLVVGAEKLYHQDKSRTFSVFDGCVDYEDFDRVVDSVKTRIARAGGAADEGAGQHSFFMDIYAAMALDHMAAHGTTQAQFAAISAKNSRHGNLNPYAQYRGVMSVEEVLAARGIAYPLTLPMCSPIGDGAAAAILVSERKARQLGVNRSVRVRSSVLASGRDSVAGEEAGITELAAKQAYDEAGVGPDDLDVIELHDASAPSELIYYETLGLCPRGQGGQLAESGDTALGGRIPVNPSGGLLRKGHPIGATGLAQIAELTWQLRGVATGRQVSGARVALAENGGGYIGEDAAAMVISVLSC
ncbi:thiolase family protein [Parahaliea mediterranea]|uniref:thiolase family protein n=1 Tax=Parahaliea mediterranea TaxID=651086 RepID=UPI001F4EA0AF|nr:thiolase family protein [Parahaliea mediterranea]